MGKMGYAAHRSADTEEEFENTVEDYEVFCFDGYGYEYDEEWSVGE